MKEERFTQRGEIIQQLQEQLTRHYNNLVSLLNHYHKNTPHFHSFFFTRLIPNDFFPINNQTDIFVMAFKTHLTWIYDNFPDDELDDKQSRQVTRFIENERKIFIARVDSLGYMLKEIQRINLNQKNVFNNNDDLELRIPFCVEELNATIALLKNARKQVYNQLYPEPAFTPITVPLDTDSILMDQLNSGVDWAATSSSYS